MTFLWLAGIITVMFVVLAVVGWVIEARAAQRTRVSMKKLALLAVLLFASTAHAATATYLGKGGLFLCQTSSPVTSSTYSQIWIRCSDGAVIYTDTSGVDHVVYPAAGGSTTFALVYNATTPASNTVTEATAGGPLALVGGSSQGTIFSVKDHSTNTLLTLSDNAVAILASDVAATGSALNIEFKAPSSYTTGDEITSWWTGATKVGWMEYYQAGSFGFRSASNNWAFQNANSDGIVTNNDVVQIEANGTNELFIANSAGGIGSYTGTYVSGTGIFAYSDGTQISGALGNNWKAVHSYHYTSAGTPGCTPLTAAGSSATCSVAHSSDSAFVVTVVTSGSGIATGDQVSLAPTLSYEQIPVCTTSGVNIASAGFHPFYDVGTSSISAIVIGASSTPSGTEIFSVICMSPAR